MADRVIKKKITVDERVAQLPIEAQLLYAYSIPYIDNDGRMPGEPDAVRALAAPLLPWSDHQVDALIAEWTHTTRTIDGQLAVAPLVSRYQIDPPRLWRETERHLEFECRLALQFHGVKNQPSRFRRGARSTLPPPDPAAIDGQMLLLAQGDHLGQVGQVLGDAGTANSRPRAEHQGFDFKPSLFEVQAAAAARARIGDNLPDPVARFRASFAAVFGRTSPAPVGPRMERLALALTTVGEARASEFLAARAARDAERRPRSVLYYLDALEELAGICAAAPDLAPTAPRVVCEECGVGGGAHVAGCSRAPNLDVEAVRQEAALREFGSPVGREVAAA